MTRAETVARLRLVHFEFSVTQPAVINVVWHARRAELLVPVQRHRVIGAAVSIGANAIRRGMVGSRHRAVATLPRATDLRARLSVDFRARTLYRRVLGVDGIFERL